jgi:hypothetical protein
VKGYLQMGCRGPAEYDWEATRRRSTMIWVEDGYLACNVSLDDN